MQEIHQIIKNLDPNEIKKIKKAIEESLPSKCATEFK
jgi:hypothetical protein